MIMTEMKAKGTGAGALNRDDKDEMTSQATDGRINCIATMAYYKAGLHSRQGGRGLVGGRSGIRRK